MSIACNRLRSSGMIDYRRADIMISDRDALNAIACSCYLPIKGLLNRVGHAPLAAVTPN